MQKYNFKLIEKKWQDIWEKSGYGRAMDCGHKPKHYHLVEFPYPSGEGLHVGHCMGYGASDAYCRMKRMQGYNVLYPIGWDAFGLPTENFAIKNKIKPQDATRKNVDTFRRQMKSLGYSFDWEREINTTDPNYYKWTQWIFIKLFENGLAYKKTMLINWCPSCKIGLANEEVVNGNCERCGTKAEKREKSQWMLKITKYADRLYKDLDTVDYESRIVTQQKNWIGPSKGNEIDFNIAKLNGNNPVTDLKLSIKVFTTRIDTIFGVTYLVIAPEHDIIKKLIDLLDNKKEVKDYINKAKNKSDIERLAEEKEKTGIELKGVIGINPVNKRVLPIFIADYVLTDYATGAVMAVPCHDFRDAKFAKKYNLPIEMVISKKDAPYKSYLMGAKNITDKDLINLNIAVSEVTPTGHRKIIIPKKSINEYQQLIIDKLDPGFWNEYIGEKCVFIFKDKNGKTEVVELNENTKDKIEKLTTQYINNDKALGSIISLLAENDFYTQDIIHQDYGILINSGKYNGLDSTDAKEQIAKDINAKKVTIYKLRDWVFSRQHYWGEPIPMINCIKCGWLPVSVDMLPVKLPDVQSYEPTDDGESPLSKMTDWVNTKCPKCGGAAKRETDTMPNWAGSSWYYLAYTMQGNSKFEARNSKNNERNIFSNNKKELDYWNPVDIYNGGMEHTTLHLLYSRFWHKFMFDLGLVSKNEPYQKRIAHGTILGSDGQKMSKSRPDYVINPDDMINKFGADTLRAYIMFIGPYDQDSSWSMNGISGVHRWLNRVWNTSELISEKEDSKQLLVKINQTIAGVSADLESFSTNTVISKLMELTNLIISENSISKKSYSLFLKLLYPVVPHIASEIWHNNQLEGKIDDTVWPIANEKYLIEDMVKIAVSINGKTKEIIVINKNASKADVEKIAKENNSIALILKDKKIVNVIYVTGRIINFVIK